MQSLPQPAAHINSDAASLPVLPGAACHAMQQARHNHPRSYVVPLDRNAVSRSVRFS
jgi:hypothetical protein